MEQVQQALYDEKRREDGFRAAGAGVIRWGSADQRNPRAFADNVQRQLLAHPRGMFRGHAVPHRLVA